MTHDEMIEQVKPILEEYIADAESPVDIFIFVYKDGFASTFGVGCPACAYEGIVEWYEKNHPQHVTGETKPTIN